MSRETIHVLSIEDNPGDARLIQIMLAQARSLAWDLPHLQLHWVKTLADGLTRLDQGEIDVVLTDLDLPDSQAGDTFAAVLAHAPQAPIVVLTGREDPELARQTVRAGAEDYLFKQEMSGTLLAHALLYAIERQQVRVELQQAYDEMEERVEQRTAELHAANQSLQTEIVEHKRTTETLRAREARLQSIFRAAPIGIGLVSDRVLLQVNDRICEMTGRSRQELIGQNARVLYPTREEYERVGREKYAQIHHKGTGTIETAWQRADGRIIDVLLSSTPLDPNDLTAGVTFTALDITERVQAERAREQSEERFRALVENASDMVTIIKTDGSIDYQSPAVERILGYPYAERTGLDVLQTVHPDDLERARRTFAQVAQTPNARARMRLRAQHQDGSWRILEASASNLLDNPSIRGILANSRDITEQVESEEMNQFLSAIVEQVQDSVIVTDTDYRITYLNQATQELFGYTPEELLGQRPDLLNAEPMAAQIQQEIYETVSSGQVWLGEHLNRKKDGSTFICEFKITPLVDDQGQITGYISIQRDVTERKRAEQTLEESEAKYRLLAENTTDLITRHKPDGTVLFASEAARSLHGYTPQELLGSSSLTRVHPNDLDLVRSTLNDLLETGQDTVIEYRSQHKNGTYIWVETTSRLLRDERGDTVEIICVTRDATERVRAQQALQASEARYRTLFEQAHDAIHVENAQDRIVNVNQRACELFGYSRQELLAMTVADLQAPEVRGQPGNIVRNEVADHGGSTFETLDVDRTGRRIPVEVSVAPIAGLDQDLYMSIVRDITERREAEAALEQKARALARSNADLEQFAHALSHDLRAPLRTVVGHLNILRREHDDKLSPQAEALLGYAVEGAERMQKMIGGLLDFSRVHTQGQPFGPVDCRALLDDVLNDLSLSIEESGACVTHDPLPTVWADPVQLSRVFQNLIDNAVKFRGADPPRIHLSAKREEQAWLFSLRDNGVGIDPDHGQRIFEIFQRLHTQEDYVGTGLGLALCQKIVERHGGRIWVESQPGQGSTFYFTLPIPAPALPASKG